MVVSLIWSFHSPWRFQQCTFHQLLGIRSSPYFCIFFHLAPKCSITSPITIACHVIPVCICVCILGSRRSQYACGDSMTHNPRMHTGIKINPCMHTGIAQIPVDIPDANNIPAISLNAELYPLNTKKYQTGERHPQTRMGSNIPEHTNNIQMGSGAISPNANGEQYDIPECKWGAMQTI